jgi:hypothetical protein
LNAPSSNCKYVKSTNMHFNPPQFTSILCAPILNDILHCKVSTH